MLLMKPSCECCDVDLGPDSLVAWVCSFECTWCSACVERCLSGGCPNCGGELTRRPTRAVAQLVEHPASDVRVHQPGLHKPTTAAEA
ncbi:DUF1272 domain-containing protein [Solicola gregarius]|uniref:DUF1272 domain-containing protein n=1 Tax=Solicola gregarius TaxID=2908642 RepID=A0AA46TF40_9ACTN|nr:DUF1272 domain-containing protein [Solicola gregarius]UYM04192.1 DUF1272 domain-containing protein [Solicola gregarius]